MTNSQLHDATIAPDPEIRIHRTRTADEFTVVPNALITDSSVSRFARSCQIEILSNSPGWRTSAKQMWRQSVNHPGEGRDTYLAAFRDLEVAGYIHRIIAQDFRGGPIRTTLHFYDVPFAWLLPSPESPAPGGPGLITSSTKQARKCARLLRPGDPLTGWQRRRILLRITECRPDWRARDVLETAMAERSVSVLLDELYPCTLPGLHGFHEPGAVCQREVRAASFLNYPPGVTG